MVWWDGGQLPANHSPHSHHICSSLYSSLTGILLYGGAKFCAVFFSSLYLPCTFNLLCPYFVLLLSCHFGDMYHMIENSGCSRTILASPWKWGGPWWTRENCSKSSAPPATLLYCTPFSGSAPRHGDISINHGRGIRGGGASPWIITQCHRHCQQNYLRYGKKIPFQCFLRNKTVQLFPKFKIYHSFFFFSHFLLISSSSKPDL